MLLIATVAEYMSPILETDDPDLLLLTLGAVARARGMAQVAKDSGLGHESLYKSLLALCQGCSDATHEFLSAPALLHGSGPNFVTDFALLGVIY